MKKTILTLSILLVSHFIFGQTKNFIDQPYLETTSKVDTLVKPDLIYLNILIREKDKRNRVSVEELENKMADKLISLGIDLKKQLTLSDLASNFKKYFLRRTAVLKNKAFSLKVYDAQTAGKVLVGLEKVGISNVTLGNVEYSKIEVLKLLLRSKAVEKAKKQAEYLIKPLHQKIAGALYISDRSSLNISRLLEGRVAGVMIRGASSIKQKAYQPVQIEFKPIKVESEVTVRFKIE